MKTRYSSIVGVLAVLLLLASFLVPGKFVAPAPVEADPGLMEWTPVTTPDTEPAQTKQLYTPRDLGSEVIKLLVGNDGSTMYALVRSEGQTLNTPNRGEIVLLKSTNGGVSWTSMLTGTFRLTVRSSRTLIRAGADSTTSTSGSEQKICTGTSCSPELRVAISR